MARPDDGLTTRPEEALEKIRQMQERIRLLEEENRHLLLHRDPSGKHSSWKGPYFPFQELPWPVFWLEPLSNIWGGNLAAATFLGYSEEDWKALPGLTGFPVGEKTGKEWFSEKKKTEKTQCLNLTWKDSKGNTIARSCQLNWIPESGFQPGYYLVSLAPDPSGKEDLCLENELLNGTSDLVILFHPSGQIKQVNQRLINDLGFEESEILNWPDPISRLIPAKDQVFFRQTLEMARHGHVIKDFHTEIQTQPGKKLWVHCSVKALSDPKSLILIGKDETHLRQEAGFRNLILESIQDNFYVLDKNFCFSYINESCSRLFGRSAAELLGKSIWEVFPILAQGEFKEQAYKAMATQNSCHFEFYSEVFDDWFDESFYPSETGMSVFFRSVSERKRAEKELENQIYFFEQSFMQSGIATMLLEVSGKCLRINNKHAALFGITQEQIDSHPYNILEDPEVKRVGGDVHIRKIIEEKSVQNWEVTFNAGRAAHELGYQLGQPGEFRLNSTGYPILNSEGNITHIIIQFEDVTPVRLSESELKKSETKFRNLIYNMGLGLLEVDTENTIVKAYPQFCQMVGYEEEELIGKCAAGFLAPVPESVYLPRIELSETYEKQLRCKDGRILDVLVNSSPITSSDGTVIGSLGIHYDISDRIRTEKELKKQNELAETILNNIPIMIGFMSSPGIYEYVNPQWEKELGWTDEQIRNHPNLLSALYPDTNERNAVLQFIEEASHEWKDFLTFSRNQGFIHTSWINIPLSDGRILALGQNISDRKKAEKELKISNERFEFVTRATFDAIWDSDLVNGSVYWGEGFQSLFGYTPEDLASRKWAFRDYLHPEDQNRVMHTFNSSLMGNATNWIEEYRFRKADGTYAYVQDKAIIIRNAEEKAIRIIGAMQDITRLKEEELRLKLLESVITHSTDSILIAEVNEQDPIRPKLVYVNEAYTRMTGFELEDVKGSPAFLSRGPETDENDQARINEALFQKQPLELEARAYRKNGDVFWVYLSLLPIQNSPGKISHWISIQRDTSRKKIREMEREQLVKELTQSNQELKQFSFITSHNMRAPLTNLVAISELLDLSQIEDETTRKLLDGFRISTQNLNNTLNDLIEILVIRDQKEVEISTVDFMETFRKVEQSISNTIKESSALIHTNFSASPAVRFSATYMESIFLNLITNAIKYARKDRKPILFVYSMETEDAIQLVFEDNGLGFNLNKVQHRLFGLYQKFHNHPDSKGIGLYLVHSQITALGGTIEVESEENEGTKFIISFPNRV